MMMKTMRILVKEKNTYTIYVFLYLTKIIIVFFCQENIIILHIIGYLYVVGYF